MRSGLTFVATCWQIWQPTYTTFGFAPGDKLPLRADHIGYELEFMHWLISQRRQASRLALFDRPGGRADRVCELAQRRFFGDHLGRWAGPLASGLRKNTERRLFRAAGAVPGGLGSPWSASFLHSGHSAKMFTRASGRLSWDAQNGPAPSVA